MVRVGVVLDAGGHGAEASRQSNLIMLKSRTSSDLKMRMRASLRTPVLGMWFVAGSWEGPWLVASVNATEALYQKWGIDCLARRATARKGDGLTV